jgi:hypothetical protein
MKSPRVLFLTLAIALTPWSLWAQGVAYTGTVRTKLGQAVSGANIAICTYPANLNMQQCSPLANLFSDAKLTQPVSNPMSSDTDGNFSFFAAPGTYVFQISGSDITTQTLTISLPSPSDRIGGVYRVGSLTYPCTAQGINAAITAAITNGSGPNPGGVVDARACIGNLTMSEPIIVGDSSSDPVTLMLPTGAVWSFMGVGPRSCDIEQFPSTVIEGPAGGGGGIAGRMQIRSANGSTPYAYYCTSAAIGLTSEYGFFHASGFMAYNPNGVVTSSGYSIVIKTVADNSVFSNIYAGDHTNNGFLIAHGCCGASFYNLTASANDSGGVPLTVGQGPGVEGDHDINFFGGSFDHARPGDNQVLFNEPPYTGGPINFFGTYVEGNTTSQDTAPLIEIGANGVALGLHFYGLTVFPMLQETVYGMHIPSGQHTGLSVSGMFMRSFADTYAIQDERHNITIMADRYGRVPTYDTSEFLTPSGPAGLVPVTAELGTVTLAFGSGSATLTFKNTPICTATDTTAANAVKARATASTLTLMGTGSDVISYICIGNPN